MSFNDIQNKISCVVHNNTNIAYINPKAPKTIDVLFDVLRFKDGTIRVSISNLHEIKDNPNLVVCKGYIESLDDLMVCAQLLDIIKRKLPNITSCLKITSPIYSRYDRVMLDDKNDSFAAKMFSNFVDASGYDIVQYVDCHSNVLIDLTNKAYDTPQYELVQQMLNLEDYNTIAPDKGAVKKNKTPNLVFDKVRELSTGKILGIELIKAECVDLNKDFIVIDDLCEGGGTFLGVHESFVENYPNCSIDLYVTYGLFTNNAIPKLLECYRKIYVYIMKESVYYSLTEQGQDCLVVHTLIKE